MIKKLWTDNKRKLTEGEEIVRAEVEEQGAGDAQAALQYAAVTIHAARAEQARLWESIKDQRLVIQRLQFPRIYPPHCPTDTDEIAQEIYAVAAHIVELMQRAGMQGDYEVTFNSMVEIASFGQPLCVASEE
jgi:hypothetical protein